ncbi:hypothetical protein SUGI_0779020 [Cryptomeria japonica]|nr:hypothetical protein SUGI_0779020 [Cryptomeria japonica]
MKGEPDPQTPRCGQMWGLATLFALVPLALCRAQTLHHALCLPHAVGRLERGHKIALGVATCCGGYTNPHDATGDEKGCLA